MNLVLDVNCELFPLSKGQKVNFVLTKSIKSDSAATTTSYNPNEGPSLADKFEYVCYGQVYKLEEIPGGKM
jgi:DNA-directed RNA polymerases I, II, and III subunit RPABC3